MPARSRLIVPAKGNKLAATRAKLANAASRQVSIVCIGDSITEGFYSTDAADNSDGVQLTFWQTSGWVAKLRGLYANTYGHPGYGFWPCRPGTNFTLGGGAANQNASSFGSFKYNWPLSASTHTVTMTTPSDHIDTIRVYAFNNTTAAFRYQIDGGTLTTSSPAPTNTDAPYSVDIAVGANTAHTLLLQGPTSGTATISGVGYFDSSVKGVAVHRAALAGKVLKDATTMFDGTAAGNIRSIRSQTTAFAADLVVIFLSANNVTGGWSTYALTVEQVYAGFCLVVDQIIADGADVLLVTGPWRDPTSVATPPSNQATYDAAIKRVAASRPRCAYLDLKTQQVSYAVANARGFYLSGDVIHPGSAGHIEIANAVYNAIATL